MTLPLTIFSAGTKYCSEKDLPLNVQKQIMNAGCCFITGCFKRARRRQSPLPSSQQRRYDHSSPSSSSNNYNPLRWYASKLDTHPIMTKMITSGIIAASGDVLCQYLTTTAVTNRSSEEPSSSIIEVVSRYDSKRTIRFFILGSCLVAPTVHVWYNILMKRIPGTNVTSILKRLTADQGFFGPIFTGTFISCLTVLEHVIPNKDNVDASSGKMMMMTVGGKETTATIIDGNSSSLYMNIITRLQNDLPNAIIVGWAMWIPSMAFMFTFVPGKYQVLFSNGVGLVWNTYLSWRTNQEDDDG